jgi:hypothetical protein
MADVNRKLPVTRNSAALNVRVQEERGGDSTKSVRREPKKNGKTVIVRAPRIGDCWASKGQYRDGGVRD